MKRTSEQGRGILDATAARDGGRRRFLRLHVAAAALSLTALAPGRGLAAERRTPPTPPGSVSRARFFRQCTACQLCVNACPSRVLRPASGEYGPWALMLPVLDFRRGYCNYDCLVCGEVCPAGAIRPLTLEDKHLVSLGRVRFLRDLCVVTVKGENCGACAEHCPTLAVKMVPFRGRLTIPEVSPDLCVGCGACEHACPVTPERAIVVEGLAEHATARILEKAREVERRVEDFGF